MGLLSRFRGKAEAPRRVAVIGLDGTPYSFLKRLLDEGAMPNLARILEAGGSLHRMNSVYPTVSSVAWASFMTGMNPGAHNIYGFVDRKPRSYDLYFPNARSLQAPTLWQRLAEHGKRMVVINVPVTYPTRHVDGVMVGCFLCTDIEKISTDPAVVRWLKEHGYRIDADTKVARSHKPDFLGELNLTLEKREEALFHFLRTPWDYFQCHIMETDRLQHFFWEEMEQGDARFAPEFLAIYRRVDDLIGRVRRELPEDVPLFVLSDHGFCTIRQEVFLNRHLIDAGFLRMRPGSSELLSDIDGAATTAYSLIPGRIYVNLKGREPAGIVEPGAAFEEVRERLARSLLDLRDPEGRAIIEKVLRREEIYHGGAADAAPDLVAVPADGFDLKGRFRAPELFQRSPLNGMHTFHDSMLLADRALPAAPDSIVDVMPTLLDLMGIPAPAGLDGRSLLAP